MSLIKFFNMQNICLTSIQTHKIKESRHPKYIMKNGSRQFSLFRSLQHILFKWKFSFKLNQMKCLDIIAINYCVLVFSYILTMFINGNLWVIKIFRRLCAFRENFSTCKRYRSKIRDLLSAKSLNASFKIF